SFAREAGARITALYAKPDFMSSFPGEGALDDLASPEKFEAITDRHAKQYLLEVKDMCGQAGVACDMVAATSDTPYKAIIETAEKVRCDLIMMASHGRKGLSGLLMGSETHKVLTHSKIPVLVYR
ncbi:MAG: universal stress protein, partial [Brachymonas sp.]|nr:universal stress protein [Brachymonas sp.]